MMKVVTYSLVVFRYELQDTYSTTFPFYRATIINLMYIFVRCVVADDGGKGLSL